MKHHRLDQYPIPKDKTPLYVNEPWLVDRSLLLYSLDRELEDEGDNIRIYIPMDLNRNAILRRLDIVIAHYGEANERNEMDFGADVDMIICQLEIYDQIWFVRHMPSEGEHSDEAIALAKEIVARLEEISDGCAEQFPFETIDQLKQEYFPD